MSYYHLGGALDPLFPQYFYEYLLCIVNPGCNTTRLPALVGLACIVNLCQEGGPLNLARAELSRLCYGGYNPQIDSGIRRGTNVYRDGKKRRGAMEKQHPIISVTKIRESRKGQRAVRQNIPYTRHSKGVGH